MVWLKAVAPLEKRERRLEAARHFVNGCFLATDASAAGAAGERFDFRDRSAVPVAGNRVLPCGGRGGEFDGAGGFIAAQQGMDEAAGEAVPCPDAVHDGDVVPPGKHAANCGGC